MYIFAGRFKGRRLFFPPSQNGTPHDRRLWRHRRSGYGGRSPHMSGEKRLRPTTGLVRRALFDILAPGISGSSFLDLYAGTGAVGMEAVSRGAGKVILIESNPDTAVYLKKNLELIISAAAKEGEEISEKNLRFYPYSAEKAIAVLSKKGEFFDIIFADPPYNFSEEKITEMLAQIIGTPPRKGGVRRGGILNPGGTLVLQHISGLEKRPLFQEGIAALSLTIQTRRYGYTSLSFFYPYNKKRQPPNLYK